MIDKKYIIEKSKPATKKDFSGVYFLIYKSEIVYVGSSVGVIKRINAHKKGRFLFRRCFWIKVDEKQERLDLEYEFIKKFNPLYNFEGNIDYYLEKKELIRTFLRKWHSTKEVANACNLIQTQLINDVVLGRNKYASPEQKKKIERVIMKRHKPLNRKYLEAKFLKFIENH